MCRYEQNIEANINNMYLIIEFIRKTHGVCKLDLFHQGDALARYYWHACRAPDNVYSIFQQTKLSMQLHNWLEHKTQSHCIIHDRVIQFFGLSQKGHNIQLTLARCIGSRQIPWHTTQAQIWYRFSKLVIDQENVNFT